MRYNINYIKQPTQQELDTILTGLDQHAKQTVGAISFKPFGFLAHDHENKLIAGCTGVLMYGVIYIKLLWVNEAARGCGIGTELVNRTEEYAKKNKCRYITVDTFNWQAKDFYKKLGFKVEHIYDGYDNDGEFYFLRKKINFD